MYEKERDYIQKAIKEPLELECCKDLESYGIYKPIPAMLFRVRGISGIRIPDDKVLLVSFDDRLPVDDGARSRGNVDYNWRPYFGKLEIRECVWKKGILGKKNLKLEKYQKVKFTNEMWKKGETFSLWEQFWDTQAKNQEDQRSDSRPGEDTFGREIPRTQKAEGQKIGLKIKEVEKRVEMTSANIRYYEKEGLLHPERDAGNNYREYSEENIRRLEEIKKLRLLGIPISEIKKLYSGESSLPDVIQSRLRQLEKERKSLELMRSICQNALEQRIEMDSLDALEMDTKRSEWKERLDVILSEDCYQDMITRKQMNFQVMLMMVWGYLFSMAVTVLVRNVILGHNAAVRDQNIARKNHWITLIATYGNSADIVYGGKEGVSYVMWACIALSVFLAIALFWTANMKWQLVFFHLGAVICPVMSLSAVYINEKVAVRTAAYLPFLWLFLAAYVLFLWLISVIQESFFTKLRYTVSAWALFVLFAGVVLSVTQTGKVFIIVSTAVIGVVSLFLTLEWTFVNIDNQIFNRYDAVLVSSQVINLLSYLISKKGNYGSGNIFRR